MLYEHDKLNGVTFCIFCCSRHLSNQAKSDLCMPWGRHASGWNRQLQGDLPDDMERGYVGYHVCNPRSDDLWQKGLEIMQPQRHHIMRSFEFFVHVPGMCPCSLRQAIN